MSKYEKFRNRMTRNGSDRQTATKERSKKIVYNRIMKSPSLSYVKVNDEKEKYPVIISQDKRYLEKRFLFLPDTKVTAGSLITEDNGRVYLALNRDDDDIYPQLLCELCNHDFVITTESKKVIIDYNEMGMPIYEEQVKEMTVPSVLYTNVYSTLGNTSVSLPSGALIVRIPYDEEYLKYIHKNDPYEMNTGTYRITEISREYVIYGEEGFVEITLQRKVEDDE